MKTNETFILAHLSDPHLAYHHGIRLADFLNKRLFGYIKWRLRRKSEHHDDVLAEMIQDLKRSRPDHIVVTGDLTHLGLPAEFAKAKELLSNLGTPSQVTIIPGNHDAYVDGALDCRLSEWADYMVSDGLKVCDGTDSAGNAVFPSLRCARSCGARGRLHGAAVFDLSGGRLYRGRPASATSKNANRDRPKGPLPHRPYTSSTDIRRGELAQKAHRRRGFP